ncbi:MAG: glycerol-3-phosphate dehydrogenase/oxidase [Thermoplasmata archaeon]
MEFSYFTRKRELETLDGKEFDAIILGGGIAGAGIAGVLSANGLEVLIVDRGDFGSGTSSNSSKLIHGGLRYLAQGHVLLTRELLRERNYLMENVDIVRKMDFDILIDDNSWSRSSIFIGLFLYNLLGGKPGFPRFSRGKYSYKGFSGYFSYIDAITDDALLVAYNVVSAVMNGTTALNYVSAERISDSDGRVEVLLKDVLGGRNYSVKGGILINATGSWINEVYERYTGKRIEGLKLSRGVHLILKNKGNVANAIAFRSHVDGRQMFIIPRGQVLIAGTTDDFTNEPWDDHVEESEREYIFKSISRILVDIRREDVIGEYVGVRPLYGRGTDPGRVTRDFHVDVTGRMVSVMGVKITNYRNASRKVSKKIGRLIGREIRTYGLPVISYRRGNGDPIDAAIRQECAITVEDVIRRRTGAFYFTIDQGRSIEEDVKRKISEFRSSSGMQGQG